MHVTAVHSLGEDRDGASWETRAGVLCIVYFIPSKASTLVVAILISVDLHSGLVEHHLHHSADLVRHVEAIRKGTDVVDRLDGFDESVLARFDRRVEGSLVD